MKNRVKKIELGLAVLGGILAVVWTDIGIGFLVGLGLALVLYRRNDRFWNDVADTGHATKFTGMFHFLINYALMIVAMLAAVRFEKVLNIFAVAFGLSGVKLAVILDEILPEKKEGL